MFVLEINIVMTASIIVQKAAKMHSKTSENVKCSGEACHRTVLLFIPCSKNYTPVKNLVAKYTRSSMREPLKKRGNFSFFQAFVDVYLNVGVVMAGSIVVETFSQNA